MCPLDARAMLEAPRRCSERPASPVSCSASTRTRPRFRCEECGPTRSCTGLHAWHCRTGCSRAQAGLEAVRGRGGDRPRADFRTPGFVHNRSISPEREGLRHPDVAIPRSGSSVGLSHETSACFRDIPQCAWNSPIRGRRSMSPAASDAAAGRRRNGAVRSPEPRPSALVLRQLGPGDGADSPSQLDALNGYTAAAGRLRLPPLTAIDEASVEPSPRALRGLLGRLPGPVVLSGRDRPHRQGRRRVRSSRRAVAHGHSATGQILYYREVSTAGWPSRDVLIRYVRAALARAPKTAASARARSSPGAAGARGPASASGPAARSGARAGGQDPCTPGLSDRGQRLGVVVPPVPRRVRAVCLGVGALRAADRFLGADAGDSSSDAQSSWPSIR